MTVERSPLAAKERELYQQIHPAKLGTDIGSFLVSTYVICVHQLGLGVLAGFIPTIVASLVVVKFSSLERQASSPFGRYIKKCMSRAMEATSFAGLFVSWAGAWYHSPTFIALGILIVVLA
jgi:hypothetical protein